MTVQIDLFGQPLATEPEILRSARFVDDGRIELHRRFGDGRTACVIGHNPSEAGGDRDDPTSRWWNRWFPRFGFGAYTAVNLYPWICSAPAECYNRVAAHRRGLRLWRPRSPPFRQPPRRRAGGQAGGPGLRVLGRHCP
jgi:hypothetical protein